MSGLFDILPSFPPALPDDELSLLAILPVWPVQQELAREEEPAAKRLKARGLINIEWAKSDPIAVFRTGYAGKLEPAAVRQAT